MERALDGKAPPNRQERQPTELEEGLAELAKDPKSPLGKIARGLIERQLQFEQSLTQKQRDEASRALVDPKHVDNVEAIAQKFNAAIKLALADPETQKKLAELGNTARYETIEQFKATVKRDRAKWAEVVKAVGAKID